MAWPNGTRYKTAAAAGSWVPGDMNAVQDQVLQVAGYRGKKITAGAEARTNVAYGTLATADEVTGITIPTDGVIKVSYRALWKDVVATAHAAIFVDGNQLKRVTSGVAPVMQETSLAVSPGYAPLYTIETGLVSGVVTNFDTTLVTTGQNWLTQPVEIDGLPAGTYTIGVRFSATAGGTVTVKDRKLLVWTETHA